MKCEGKFWIDFYDIFRKPNNECAPSSERATLGLARVGSRAALSFAFAFLRRAWRSGEDQVEKYAFLNNFEWISWLMYCVYISGWLRWTNWLIEFVSINIVNWLIVGSVLWAPLWVPGCVEISTWSQPVPNWLRV